MKIFKKVAVAIALSALLSHGLANAAVIEIDWKVEADGRAFLDEATGTEWVSLTETVGKSINYFTETQTGIGGFYEGFRVANRAEIAGLMNSVMGMVNAPADSNFVQNASRGGEYESFVNSQTDYMSASGIAGIMGNVSKVAGLNAKGFYKNEGAGRYFPSSALTASVYAFTGARKSKLVREAIITTESAGSPSNNYNTSSTSHGVFLVSDGGATFSTRENMALVENNPFSQSVIEVPEPGTLAFIGLTLTGLALRRKKGNGLRQV
jgi:hypothetical protein